nr:C2H2-type zinc finger protein [Halomarina sp. BCD28]
MSADHTPDPEGGPHTCGYCGRPFAREAWLALHRGLDHEGEITEAEREAFEAAYEGEEADLRMFRLQALGVLVLVYFTFLIVYGLVT